MNPNISGKNAQAYIAGGAGVGTFDASAGILVTQYYVVGPNANKVTMKDFSGTFTSFDIGASFVVDVGVGASFSTPFKGATIIGISTTVGVGFSGTVVSGGISGGYMDFW